MANVSKSRIPGSGRKALGAVVACVLLAACASQPEYSADLPLENAGYLPEPDITVQIPSLSSCTSSRDTDLRLNSEQPVTVIVHGCFASEGRFRSLADVFAFHGQQTLCFDYNDRDSLEVSSAELIRSLEALSTVLKTPTIQVIGHSQGGLVARRALTQERADRLVADNAVVTLTTISAPFGGIEAASHCGSEALAWLSLGLVKPVCLIVTGEKYKEIPPGSDFMLHPGRLLPFVDRHLKIVTDEKNSCRKYSDKSECIEDDYVFSLLEQDQPAIEGDVSLEEITVKSGHIEIVGDVTISPTKLIEILQREGILLETPADSKASLELLLARLYQMP
ncbi:MAG: hypothetical protein MUP31_01970 [Xanthomonadales bacterium]|nr:hypothetical protein [Xanthomonadales bacterium]